MSNERAYPLDRLVIYRGPSDTASAEEWQPVMPNEVPEWLKDPDVMAELRDGYCVQDAALTGDDWFRAERVDNNGTAVLAGHA